MTIRARARKARKPRDQRSEAWIVAFDDLAAPVQPDDLRRSLECTEQQRDPSILAQVRHRLDPAAGQIQVGDGVEIDDSERVEALRRKVDVARGVERCGGDEEHPLRFQKAAQRIVDLVVRLPHGS
jgi:hypothetical protein